MVCSKRNKLYLRFKIERMNKLQLLVLFSLFGMVACQQVAKVNVKQKEKQISIALTQEQAERLAALPFKCVQQEYPNNLGQVLNSDQELKSPKQLHPAFYGCFDWHSSVHGHWLMVRILKAYPNLKQAKQIRARLNTQLTAATIQQELAFFKTQYNDKFERTYGWAWLFKLHQELLSWEDQDGQKWAKALEPLAQLLVKNYETYLPKLVYPLRNGTHTNTAFGLTLAYDYAVFTNNQNFKAIIEKRSKDFFLNDKNAPLNFEPSGYDFLSPSLEEADLMRRTLPKAEFIKWLDAFLPQLKQQNFELAVGIVGDRSDGHLVHLDGVNFSRAWCFYELARVDEKYKHLRKQADKHLAYSLPSIVDGDYMGEHWLATFALSALLAK